MPVDITEGLAQLEQLLKSSGPSPKADSSMTRLAVLIQRQKKFSPLEDVEPDGSGYTDKAPTSEPAEEF